MESQLTHLDAADAFAALGSEARLAILRLLVRAGTEGISVGAVQERLDLPASTLSHHLKALTACGLASQERQGRSLICRAAFERIEALAEYLTHECCAEQRAQCPEPTQEARVRRGARRGK
ncbi:MAG: metalloregulator ArsR/SmtB family transcription factor [Neomegalonema sp.]|nr:metalloregulator ArsR/SmtB family transcription factor [Neomegalonema sp.]